MGGHHVEEGAVDPHCVGTCCGRHQGHGRRGLEQRRLQAFQGLRPRALERVPRDASQGAQARAPTDGRGGGEVGVLRRAWRLPGEDHPHQAEGEDPEGAPRLPRQPHLGERGNRQAGAGLRHGIGSAVDAGVARQLRAGEAAQEAPGDAARVAPRPSRVLRHVERVVGQPPGRVALMEEGPGPHGGDFAVAVEGAGARGHDRTAAVSARRGAGRHDHGRQRQRPDALAIGVLLHDVRCAVGPGHCTDGEDTGAGRRQEGRLRSHHPQRVHRRHRAQRRPGCGGDLVDAHVQVPPERGLLRVQGGRGLPRARLLAACVPWHDFPRAHLPLPHGAGRRV
mmetsp:Transcript_50769/g.142685  ORF Transcript_50769/g.142685 Transcript_50769/m.142685 type:complete len:337 (-) Transcript_50769:417-1427(-)